MRRTLVSSRSWNCQSSALYCQRITSQANSSFPIAFRLLPPAKRRTMESLYAFLRLSDDLADEPGATESKRSRLLQWRSSLEQALAGDFSHPVHPALIKAIQQYRIPEELLFTALDGVEMDLVECRFDGFADLYSYCYRVASVVGLACIRIWGFRAGMTLAAMKSAEASAEAAGIAFQMTNILRDLREDAERGRIYLPVDELKHHGVTGDNWRAGRVDSRDQAVMEFQIQRARDYYRLAQPLDDFLSSDGRAIFRVMSQTYEGLLNEIARDPLAVFRRRLKLSRWRKGLAFLEGCGVRFGLL